MTTATINENTRASLAALFEKAESDKVFAARLESCDSAHEVFVLGKGLITVDEAEFTTALETLPQLVSEANGGGAELSEGELDAVVGGSFKSWWKAHWKTVWIGAKTLLNITASALGLSGVAQVVKVGAKIGVSAATGITDATLNELKIK